MEKISSENAYLIEDLNSFCMSVQPFNPTPSTQTFSFDEVKSVDSYVGEHLKNEE